MNKNNKVDTAKKGQTTTNIQPEKVQNNLKTIQENRDNKKSKVPTGKVILLKETEARKKAREEQYANFRINALKRRCERMKLSEEDTNKLIEKLKQQLKTPNNYSVIIMFNKNDVNLVKEALKNEGIICKVTSDTYVMIDADQETLTTIRGITPPSAKIYPYVKKKPPILPAQKPKEDTKMPSNKAEKKSRATNAKLSRKINNTKMHKKAKKRFKTLQDVRKRTKATTIQLQPKKAAVSVKTTKNAA